MLRILAQVKLPMEYTVPCFKCSEVALDYLVLYPAAHAPTHSERLTKVPSDWSLDSDSSTRV